LGKITLTIIISGRKQRRHRDWRFPRQGSSQWASRGGSRRRETRRFVYSCDFTWPM